jgi:hypothetical protein
VAGHALHSWTMRRQDMEAAGHASHSRPIGTILRAMPREY